MSLCAFRKPGAPFLTAFGGRGCGETRAEREPAVCGGLGGWEVKTTDGDGRIRSNGECVTRGWVGVTAEGYMVAPTGLRFCPVPPDPEMRAHPQITHPLFQRGTETTKK